MARPLAYDVITVHSLTSLPDATFLAVELLMLTGFVLAIVHARRNGPSAVLTLVGCFVYGLVVDITAYYTTNSFRHGEFTVMFLNHRLPLYIALFYPAFMYPIFMTIRRFALPWWAEAAGVGFYGGISYLIFDNLGPMLRWWRWDRSSDWTKPFVDSVPLTSYVWFFLFTTAFAFVARRICWERAAGRTRGRTILEVALIPVLTYLVGAVLFIPFDVLLATKKHTAAGFLYAIALGAAGLTFLVNLRRVRPARDRLLLVFPLLWVGGLVSLYVATWHYTDGTVHGITPDGRPVGSIVAVVLAAVVSVAITLSAHPRSEV